MKLGVTNLLLSALCSVVFVAQLRGPTKYFRIDGSLVSEVIPQIIDGTLNVGTAPVPEPAATALISAIALLGMAGWRRFRQART